jgi:ligand-binding sensor domain-containing protein/serine phosphatase RsbU (regulator of sigma subunit)
MLCQLGLFGLMGVSLFAGNLFQHDRLSFQNYGLLNGLSQSTVQVIFQDSSGIMWFGTQNGLNRFDGYQFVSYAHQPFEGDSLNGNFVNYIFEQNDGTLWVGDGPVLHRLHRDSEKFKRYISTKEKPNPISTNHMIEDKHGNLWVAADNGVFIYDQEADSFSLVMETADKQIPNGNIFATDHSGNLWLGTWQGLYLFEDPQQLPRVFRHDPGNPNTLSTNAIPAPPGNFQTTSMIVDAMGMLWIGTLDGLNKYDPFAETFTRYTEINAFSMGMRGKRVIHLHEDSLGYLWFLTREGWLNRFDRSNNSIMAFGHNDELQSGFRGRSITHLLEDRQGRIWVSTNGGGLNVMEPGSRMWRNITQEREKGGLLSNYIQTSFRDQSGNLWFGTFDQGVAKISPERHKFRSYLTDPEEMDLNSNVVWSIEEDNENLLWIGTRSGAIVYDLYFDEVVKKYQFEEDGTGISTNEVRDIFFQGNYAYLACFNFNNQTEGTPGLTIINLDTEKTVNDDTVGGVVRIHPFGDKLVLGTFGNGMVIYDPKTREWRNFVPKHGDPTSISNRFVRSFASDPSGGLWVVTLNGLNYFDPDEETFKRFNHDINDPLSISSDNILSIHMDERERLWIGTSGAGLNLYDRETGSFTHFTTRDGLPNNVIYEILSDDQGNLWLGTNLGLSRFSPDTQEVRNFDLEDGLQSNEYNVGAGFKSPTGQLFLGGINGFDAFFTHELKQSPDPVPLVISAVNLKGETLNSEVQQPQEVQLQPDDRDVTLHFSALNFSSASGTQYAYRLLGFDDDWRFTQHQRFVTYTNLPNGDYTFELRATNDDDVWNSQPLKLPITAMPYFYETNLFKALFAAGVLMLFFSIMSWQRGRMIQRQKESMRELELARKSEELEYARDLQIGLLPKQRINDHNVDLVGKMVTATEVGGDYYDFFEIDNRRLCIAFGDATGHGVAAGLVVCMAKMAVTMWTQEPDKPIGKVIEHINRGLQQSLPKRDMGMGFGLALLDRETGEIEMAFSGMPFPFIFNREIGTLKSIELRGVPLGYLRRVRVPVEKVKLAPGDTVVFLSDGLGERFDEANNIWGDEALAKALEEICKISTDPDDIAAQLLRACDRFAGGRSNDDDMTVVVMHFKDVLTHSDSESESDRPQWVGQTA